MIIEKMRVIEMARCHHQERVGDSQRKIIPVVTPIPEKVINISNIRLTMPAARAIYQAQGVPVLVWARETASVVEVVVVDVVLNVVDAAGVVAV